MQIHSPAFDSGDLIPEEYGYTRENVNPPLVIEEVPERAESLVLIMDDPDAVEPAGKIWDHWLIWNLPAKDMEIDEDSSLGIEGQNDFGEIGYGGPNPPDGRHEYVFRLYALDTELDLPEGASREELQEAMEGHIIEKAELKGKFDPL